MAVAFLRASGVLLRKREGIVHQTAITTRTRGVAVHELLLAQRHKITRAEGPPERLWSRRPDALSTCMALLY